jgi:hypothetical protein
MRLSRLRLGLLLAILAAVAVAVGAVALAQDFVPIKISAKVKVTPNKAGTPRHPQGVKVDVKTDISIPDDYDPPLVQTVDVWISKGGLYNGAKFPRCSESAMGHGGVAACPKGSIMGHGRAKARADTVFTYPKITVINGGPNAVYFYTVLTRPARVSQAVKATVVKASGKWSYKAHAAIPRNLQIVAGIPLRFDELRVTAGVRDWLATIGCPSGNRWSYHAEATFNSGQVVKFDGSVGCRR